MHESINRELIDTPLFPISKSNYRHFMEKEIYEQPETISRILAHYMDLRRKEIPALENVQLDFKECSHLTLVGSGSAYYAGAVARYWFEKYARLPTDTDIASEFRHREPPLEKEGLVLFISPSGETPDTLAALTFVMERGYRTASVLNFIQSSMGKVSEVVLPILSGREIGIASTKTFTAELAMLFMLAVRAGKERRVLTREQENHLVYALATLPEAISAVLEQGQHIEDIARKWFMPAESVIYLGRGTFNPLALEGALKLKEVCNIHAEGYPAGELKHGPIALVDETLPVVVFAPSGELQEKTLSNMHEVRARGGKIILITDEAGAEHVSEGVAETIVMPDTDESVAPILAAIPLQLLAYHTAVHKGIDVDQSRSLAKSVTVE